jgi:hypothetical protein
MHEPIAQAIGHAGSVPAHPEEIRATLKLRLGMRGRLNATFRTTPAGLVTAGTPPSRRNRIEAIGSPPRVHSKLPR